MTLLPSGPILRDISCLSDDYVFFDSPRRAKSLKYEKTPPAIAIVPGDQWIVNRSLTPPPMRNARQRAKGERQSGALVFRNIQITVSG